MNEQASPTTIVLWLLKVIEAQDKLLAAYRIGRRPPDSVLDLLAEKKDAWVEAARRPVRRSRRCE